MKEYNEQVVETLDDAGCIIANKNIIIDNLQARIAELEGDVAIERASRKYWEDAYSEWINTDKAAQGLIAKDERIAELEAENARLKAECDDIKQVQFPRKLEAVAVGWKKQLAASQAYAEQLRVALQTFIDEHEECTDADDWMAMLCSIEAHHVAEEALALPRDTSALDAYVSEKVKEAGKFDMWKTNPYTKVLETSIEQLTKQRDLAVEALEKWDMFFGGDAETAVLTIAEDPSTLTGCQKATKEAMSAIKESEAK